MLGWVRKRFCADLAIDLGTTSTQIGLPGDGIRIDEPSVVAVPRGTNRVVGRGAAVGKLAYQMLRENAGRRRRPIHPKARRHQ